MQSQRAVVISANPKSGSRNRLALARSLQDCLNARGYKCELYTDLNEMVSRVHELHSTGILRTVVSAGGDGTASLIASLIPASIPITLFPLGSENLLAKHFDLTAAPDRTADVIDGGHTQSIDIFEVNGKFSLLVVSVGFDAEVVRRVHLARRSHVTKWNYIVAITKTLLWYSWPRVNIEVLDSKGSVLREESVSWLFAFNVPRYATGMSILPQAICDDGLLEVGTFRRGGRFRSIYYYLSVLLGRHQHLSDWNSFRAAGLRIKLNQSSGAPGVQCSYQVDGDWGSELPVEIKHSGRMLSLLIPPKPSV